MQANTRLLVLLLLLAFSSISPAQAADNLAGTDELAAQAKPQFDVWEYQIQGNSRLDAIDIERAVYAHLGPAKTIDDVEQARAALEQLRDR